MSFWKSVSKLLDRRCHIISMVKILDNNSIFVTVPFQIEAQQRVSSLKAAIERETGVQAAQQILLTDASEEPLHDGRTVGGVLAEEREGHRGQLELSLVVDPSTALRTGSSTSIGALSQRPFSSAPFTRRHLVGAL